MSRKILTDADSTDTALLRLIGWNRRVLEMGCGAGHMSEAMRAQQCRVVGMEINPDAAQKASAFCEKVISADLDYINFDDALGADRFDVVVAADVLEHVKDPESVLKAVTKFLSPGGFIVLSIPNVAHMSIRLNLLTGHFPYGASGLLDRTHLRFFTRESAQSLVEDAGFAIGYFEAIQNVPPVPMMFEPPYDPNWVEPAIYDALCQEPDIWSFQFVIAGYPLSEADLTFVQQRMKEAANEAENARKHAARLQNDADVLRNELEELKQSNAALTAQVKAMLPELSEFRYRQMLQGIRELLPAIGRKDGNVLVISRGDEELVQGLNGYRGFHFPQDVNGGYAGYYPEDSDAAIKHLEELRDRGAQFLLIPQTAMWWLDDYPQFKEHLTQRFRCVIEKPDVCLIFDLRSCG